MKTLVITLQVTDDFDPHDAQVAKMAAVYGAQGAYKDRTGEIMFVPASSWSITEQQERPLTFKGVIIEKDVDNS